MLNPEMEKALNKQVNAELYAAYLYLSMSAYCDSINLPGARSWLRVQTQEELTHAMRIYNYILERDGKITLAAIADPPTEWDSVLAGFEGAYAHEQKVTGMIDALVDLSIKLSDHATNNMLQWFVAEQVEEEASTNDVVQKLNLAGSEGGGLFMVDQELAGRVFIPPAAAQAQ